MHLPKPWDEMAILDVLDRCGVATFPMLDNGYVYLAATRLSLYRSPVDWAMTIEVFGFGPRSGLPDTQIYTFASRLHDRDRPDNYVTREAYERYLATNPHNESRFIFPIEAGDWRDDNCDYVAATADSVRVRDTAVSLPAVEEYEKRGIQLEKPPRVLTFELCRFLADTHRDLVLATAAERRVSVPPEMPQVMQLEEWRHPDTADDELPSESQTFQQLAEVLVTGELDRYEPREPPNTHWRHWPMGGRL